MIPILTVKFQTFLDPCNGKYMFYASWMYVSKSNRGGGKLGIFDVVS